MALIGTLRNSMTKWVIVGFVAVAIISFVLSDLFGNGPTALFGGPDNSVGTIAGHEISLEEFQRTVQEMDINFQARMGRPAMEREMVSLREQAWMYLVSKYAISREYDLLGLKVTDEEMYDMLQGKNVDEGLRMNYMDSTGNFDRERLISDLRSIRNDPENSPRRINWMRIRTQLQEARERLKYENLLIKTNYVTQAESEQQYHVDNDVAEIKFLYVPYFAVKDSGLVSDSDIKKYYDSHKERYKTEELRSLSYVSFPADPSHADTVAVRTDMENLAVQFRETKEDSAFATTNTTENNTAWLKHDGISLPTYLNRETITEGLVLGPFIDNGMYKVVKISDIGTDTVYNMRASHILITWKSASDADKKEAKDKANKVLAEIKKGAKFADKVMEYSEDNQSKIQGGDLGWFRSGRMVPQFEKAVKSATKTGVLNEVVETDFGYHIINVTEPKNNISYTVATIEKPLEASQETLDSVYRKADQFSSDLEGVEEFKTRASASGLSVFEANSLKSSDRFVGNLGEARNLVTWLYREASEGKVSRIEVLDNNVYVVAVMTGQVDAGYRPLDQALKDELKVLVAKEKKAEQIISKISGDAPLEELAKAYPDAVVGTSSGVKLITPNIEKIGYDPVAVGKAFSVEAGKRTKPFAGENGVSIIEVQNKTIAPGLGDYSIQKNQLVQGLDNRSSLEIAEAIRDNANIEDKRYKAY